ncbi:uncharacterized protein TrAtP1_002437 [Trichoderma atroviride]|uniref:uncharacterized protein n=1 Tax=Hypocrea atroviridis TaxID=63577 RepID=UPI00331D1EED|nr:hypothetical protein TrAtP1_002437 [Trichoderma atroviride]
MSYSDEDMPELFSTTQMPVNSCTTSELNATGPERNTLTQHFMDSSRLSSPASSAMIRTRDEAVASCYGASTMPSTAVPPSDIMEQIQAMERRNHARQQFQDIATHLQKLSLSDPEIRVAIHSRQSDGKSIAKSSSIVNAQRSADGTDTFCVAQRPEDVDYTLEIDFKTPPRHSKFTCIKCQVVYHPGSDTCVLINRTKGFLYLVHFEQSYSYSYQLVKSNLPYAIQPGLWGIAATQSDDAVDDCIVNFLLCERRHTISIYQSENGSLTGQQALGASSAAEFTTHSANSISAKELAGAKNNPLLDLQDGQFANIQIPLPKTSFRREFSTYQLDRFRKLSAKGVASVFSGRHSLLVSEILAVKVIQHKSEQPWSQLLSDSKFWKREKGFLEKLEHPNIVSLKAFDGRFLALHLELLPPSLAQGFDSPFRPSDASKILRTLSSALKYLESKGIAHNDIKPSNVAYSPGRGAVLFDFGIASRSNEVEFSGSPWYIPPEFMHSANRSPAGDVWAFGIIMLYVLKKIHYPEHMMKSWNIRGIRKASSADKSDMMVWLQLIYTTRDGLDKKSPIEYATFLMLDEDQHSRITAVGIQNTLDYQQ